MSRKPRIPQQEFLFGGALPAPAPAAPEPPATPPVELEAEIPPPEDTDPNLPHAYDIAGPLKRLMDGNFLAYASYVICDRAIPNLADGLKPVQRRILHSLHERDDGRFIKVANVVGHCMQYHPHGDASIGDALVNLANKTYLIEGQGNFGNLFTGDRAAAARYIECRLTELARKEVFNNDLTEFIPSYDGRNKEPVTLPCKIPLLLMLGAEGIAVGLSTRILPHNFIELLQAQIAVLQNKKFQLLPDFPQGGSMDVTEYDKGNGRVRVRATIEKRDARHLVIRQLPYATTTESLIDSIEDAIRKGKVPVKTINDFTAEQVEIELVLEQGAQPDKVITKLYAFTACEASVSSRVIVIHNRRPVEMNVHEVLQENTRQLVDILRRELEHRRRTLTDEMHAKTLVQIFIENRIYKRIEECQTLPAVQKAVLDGLAPFRPQLVRDVTLDDVEMLLGIKIRRISLFDMRKNEEELAGIRAELERIAKDLADLTRYAIQYLRQLVKTYAEQYPRRTTVTTFDAIELRTLTANELEVCHDRETGYLGYGVKGVSVLHCSSLDKLFLAWGDGRYKVIAPPEKLFVDTSLLYVNREDRERVFTVIYTEEQFTFMKRFAVGGTILNKEYAFAAPGVQVHLFEEGSPEVVYVKYKQAKGQRIHQQMFHPADVPVKSVKSRGNQMTAKVVDRLSLRKPSWWDDASEDPRGRLL